MFDEEEATVNGGIIGALRYEGGCMLERECGLVDDIVCKVIEDSGLGSKSIDISFGDGN